MGGRGRTSDMTRAHLACSLSLSLSLFLSFFLPIWALPRRVLTRYAAQAWQRNSPRAPPPASAPRFPRQRPLSLALLISS
eukprot:9201376-Pyramimonas_sp.AAC.1